MTPTLAPTRRGGTVASLLALALVALSGCTSFQLGSVTVDGRRATLEETREVRVTRAGEAVDVKAGMSLEKGDVVETGPRLTASIRYGSDTAVLMPGSRVEILNPSLLAFFGELLLSGSWHAETDYGSVTPKRTKFVVRVDPERESLRVRTLEGSVVVAERSGAEGFTVEEQQDVTFDRNLRPTRTRRMTTREVEEWLLRLRQAEPDADPILPDLRGLSESEARRRARLLGIREIEVTVMPAAPEQVGKVVSQSPAPDRRGASVELAVGAESVVTPDVVGLDEADAREAIEAAGLAVGRVRQDISDGRNVGKVREQDPDPEERALPGSEVDLTIEAPSVRVPNLIGLDVETAEQRLESRGLALGSRTIVKYQERFDVGDVVLQEYDSDERVPPGTSIWIHVNGSEPIE